MERRSRLMQDPGLPVASPTEAYWQQPLHKRLVGIQTPRLPQRRDVVVLGSGITGCSTTHQLLEKSSHVTVSVLDAREICSGATGRNGGRVNCVAVLDYDKYRKSFGDAAAKKIVQFELAHLAELTAVARKHAPDLSEASRIREVDSIAAVFKKDQLGRLRLLLREFGKSFPDLKGHWRIAEGQEVREVWNMDAALGALIGKAGVTWPYRMITQVWADLLARYPQRLSIEAKTPALSVEFDHTATEYPYHVGTPRGIIRANHVVHCTEGHSSHLLPGLRGILVPRRAQMTAQYPGSQFDGFGGSRSWSFYFPHGFDYVSQNPETGVLYVGGGEVRANEGFEDFMGIASDAGESVAAKSHLGGVLPAVFGEAKWGRETQQGSRMNMSWTGIICCSLDGVPMVGRLPQAASGRLSPLKHGGEWISAGYGGYGMVNSWLCGKAVANMLLGQDVKAWLPEQYVVDRMRIERLGQRAIELCGSVEHFRALL